MNSPHKVVDNSRKTPPYSSDEFKQRLVAASYQPGASLSSVAREGGVSTSALFRWRKEYPQPTLSKGLVPIVVVSAEMPGETAAGSSAVREAEAGPSGLLEITLGAAHIRVSGLVDTHALQMVLEYCRQGMGTVIRKAATSSPARKPAPINYLLNHWDALNLFCSHGLVEIDNSIAENALRVVSLGRKNYLFMGSDRGGGFAANLYTLIGTCKLNGIEPEAYLRQVLAVIADYPINQIRELLPWNVKLTSG